MTFGVAARFPWPTWFDHFPAEYKTIWHSKPEFRPSPALIFSADSRWTYPTKGVAHDGAIKLLPIDDFGAGMYAGNTDAGEVALARLATYFRECRAGVEPTELLDTIRETWQRFNRGTDDVLQLAFGFFSEREPLLFRCDSWNNFLRLEVPGVTCLGSVRVTEFFRQRLEDQLNEFSRKPRGERVLDTSPEHWSTAIQSIIWKACEDRVDDTVGGPTTCLMVSPKGLQGLSLHSVDVNDESPAVQSISLDEQTARAFYDHPWRRRRLSPVKFRYVPPQS